MIAMIWKLILHANVNNMRKQDSCVNVWNGISDTYLPLLFTQYHEQEQIYQNDRGFCALSICGAYC